MSRGDSQVGHEREMDQFWGRMDQAVASFCLKVSLDNHDKDKMVCALVGEELEWCGAHSYLFMASRYLEATNRANVLEERYESAETSRVEQATKASELRKSLKQSQLAAEDNEWQFQEQIAHSNNLLQLERQGAEELRKTIEELKGKLVEVEMYLGSDRGASVLRVEGELAATRLKLAELEEERDQRELMDSRKRSGLSVSSPTEAPQRGVMVADVPRQSSNISLAKQMALDGARSVKHTNTVDGGGDKENALRNEMW